MNEEDSKLLDEFFDSVHWDDEGDWMNTPESSTDRYSEEAEDESVG